MRIEKFFLILALAALVSCQTKDNLTPNAPHSNLPDQDTPTVLKQDTPDMSDLAVTYLADVDYGKWTSIGTIEERIEACNPSLEEVEKMSTKALVESVAHHPLNYIIFAYNDPMDAVNFLAERSTVHQELERRAKAGDAILTFYAGTKKEMSPKKRALKGSDVQFSDETFLDYYLASERIPSILTPEHKERLREIVEKKFEERMAEDASLVSIQRLGASPQLTHYVQSIGMPPLIRYSVCYTPFGKSIETKIYQDFTHDEMLAISLYYMLEWPEAQEIAPATALYNCHSYAWHDQTEYDNVWINRTSRSGFFQLQNFMNGDIYTSCSESEASLVYYPSDHSAVRLPSGLYVSKWGAAPLMIHAPEYCPYSASNRQFYKIKTNLPTYKSDLISGPTRVTPGSIVTFNRSYIANSTAQWTVKSYPSGPNAQNATILTSLTSDNLTLQIHDPGYYEIRLTVSTNNISDHQTRQIVYGGLNCVSTY